MTGPFGTLAETALDSGYVPIPMKGKTPAAKNWSRGFGYNAVLKLSQNMPDANLGILLGRLFAVDIDIDDAAEASEIVEMMQSTLGDSPYMRVGRWPRRMFFYRADDPVITLKIGPVEILGSGHAAVVCGTHPTTLQPYYWPLESLLDVDADAVPVVSASSLARFRSLLRKKYIVNATPSPVIGKRTPSTSRIGARPAGRNDQLFAALRAKAGACKTEADLSRCAQAINIGFTPPLPLSEVNGVVQSVWSYKARGTLMVPGSQKIVLPLTSEAVLKLTKTPDALSLYVALRATRKRARFEIPQKATATRFRWGSDRRVKKAIDVLISEGLLRELTRARGPGKVVRVVYGW
ncbi:bifunctional DNA primase/polymerase [Ciceribacter thiooxidans]|uniref:Bifunctional DNA primase/polymerase n=1 Tax=Ciceribacter thiooxidans TaxID=1969821 RepID=A0ABV7HWW7_9HYPH|nr:bifunctional DNA primase/polymerase [Ciceribacter thiooxidans]